MPRFIKYDVLAVLIIMVLCWQADHRPWALTYFSESLLFFQAADNDLSATRVCVELVGWWI